MGDFNDKCLQTMDAKGRLQLSTEVRAELSIKKGDTLYLLPASDGDAPNETHFIEIRNKRQWDDYRERFLREAPAHMARDFIRFVQLNKETVVADGQGRISIPRRLRTHCRLGKQVVVINLERVVEVWTPKATGAKQSDFKKAHGRISKRLW